MFPQPHNLFSCPRFQQCSDSVFFQDMSDNANSSDLNRQLKNILHQAVEEDRLSEVMQVIQGSCGKLSSAMSSASASMTDVSGSMTDASKRQRDEGWDVISETRSEARPMNLQGNQAPIPPKVTNPGPVQPFHPRGLPLPNGVISLEEWSRTKCQLPKVAKLHASYGELVNMAREDNEIHTYLCRYIMRHNGPSPKVADLRKFLEYIDYGATQPIMYMPGSTSIERHLK